MSCEVRVKLSKVPTIVEQITGERPHVATIHRWRQRGCRGVKLQTEFCGGHARTCERWVREFFAAVTAAANGESIDATPPPTSERAAKLAATERELAEAGI